MKETVQSLQEKGICPTCYHREHGGIYADAAGRMLYEDDLLECFFEARPRSAGHTIILLKEHYHDMAQLPDEACAAVYLFAKKAMNALKEVLGVERVYLCTMCDGKANHFHVQLIPRHPGAPIGSRNFVKDRTEYAANPEHIEAIREILKKEAPHA
ncbi:MAG: HIT family protein [Oscillospiraceae bacterium]|jgi:diadenosine tetraphosphate (Ap4A) HIT family hydrolase|nr:HIT family protein [Oscillospiraceae bacterium]